MQSLSYQTNASIFYRPDNSYFFFPTRNQQTIKDKRFVFYGQIQHTPKEKKGIQDYKNFLKMKKQSHSPYIDQNRIVLFLHEKNFKFQDTYKAIKVHDDWRKVSLPIKLTSDLQKMLSSGIIYLCGRDNRYRPIVVMNLKLFDQKKTDLIIQAFTYFFQQIIDKVLLPGQVQQWITIMDVEGFSLFSLPLGGGKKLLNHLQTHYRGRLYKLYLVNSPSAVWLSWKIVKQFLQDSTVQKVDIISDNKIKQLYKHTNLTQIQKKFGGIQQNRTIFWPGERIQQDFFLKTDKYQHLHVSQEKYSHMMKSLNNNIISPKYLLHHQNIVKIKNDSPTPTQNQKYIKQKSFNKLQKKQLQDIVVLPDQKIPLKKLVQFQVPIKQQQQKSQQTLQDAKRQESKKFIVHPQQQVQQTTQEIIAEHIKGVEQNIKNKLLDENSVDETLR